MAGGEDEGLASLLKPRCEGREERVGTCSRRRDSRSEVADGHHVGKHRVTSQQSAVGIFSFACFEIEFHIAQAGPKLGT